MSLGRYRRDLDAVMQALLREILSLLLGGYAPTQEEQQREQMIEDLVPEMTQHVRIARNRAHQIAARQLADEAPRGRVPYVPDQRGYAQDAVRKVLQDKMKGSPTQAGNAVAPALIRHAEQAARDTISDAVLDEDWVDESEEDSEPDEDDVPELPAVPNTPRTSRQRTRERPERGRLKVNFGDLFDDEDDLQEELDRSFNQEQRPVRPIGWARVMTGAETCAFCTMLASKPGSPERRFYTSADAAGGEMAQAQYRGTALFVNRYHDNCDCIVVPVYDAENWTGKEQAEYLYKEVYLKALGGKPAVGWRSNKYSENDVVKTLEKWLKEHQGEYSLPALREMI